jgi:hypothetical protein
LAILARSKVEWPWLVKEIFKYMSAFNLNLELTAPECSIPNLGYAAKWYFIEAIPVAVASIFLVMHLFKWSYKKCWLRRKQKLYSHVDALIGTMLTLFYFLYLFITRTSLDIFNCSPTDPPDGHEYMEAVFVECYKTGGMQQSLVMWAALTFLVYSIGYPAFVIVVLRKNKALVKEDQLLRAKGTGDTHATNKNAYWLRKRYHKLYYHFKPGRWMVFPGVILLKTRVYLYCVSQVNGTGFSASLRESC